MGIDRRTEMSTSAIDDFLARHETGVLSLARSDEPYAIPISYGYAGVDRRFYMRLVSTSASEKRTFLESTPKARLVVYEKSGETYRSVIANGVLEGIQLEDLTPEHIHQYGEAKTPLFEIWADAKPDLDIKLFELRPESISGRLVEVDRHEG